MEEYEGDRMGAQRVGPGARERVGKKVRGGKTAPECGLGCGRGMVLLGGRDATLTDEQRQLIDQRLEGAERHVLKSAGHFPMETHSKALRDYLRGWIRYNA